MVHTHTIDNKVIEFDDTTCSICHPVTAETPKEEKREILRRVYRKGNTVVLKQSKMTLITTTYWAKENLYLITFQRMLTDNDGKIVFGADRQPQWTHITLRMTAQIYQQWLQECSILINDTQHQATVPMRS